MMKRAWILMVLCCLWVGGVAAQEVVQHRPFDEKKRREITKGVDYNERKPEEKAKKEHKPMERTQYPKPREISGPSDVTRSMSYAAIFILLLFLVALFLRMILGEDWYRKKKIGSTEAINFEEIEANLMEVDITEPYKKAVMEGNYAVALRLYFLRMIQSLAQKGLLFWQRHKTNREYLRELSGRDQQRSFALVMRMYEAVWFGKQRIDGTIFKQLEQDTQSIF